MEALERRGKLVAVAAIVFIVFWSQCTGVESKKGKKMSYVCPPQFIRLGHSCYFFSDTKATWQSALFACKDRDSNLSVPYRWEDRNLRNYLNKPTIANTSRWIGGIYDYGVKAWKWGGELRQMKYHSFSRMKKISPEQLQWHCIAMVPELLYRWAPRSCLEPRQYICQTTLRQVPKSELKKYRRRWEKMGKMNEITAPTISRESNDVNRYVNPKSYDFRPSPLRARPNRRSPTIVNGYDVRPNELQKRSRSTAPRRQEKPFPGYEWHRDNPEGSYWYNVNLLRSGRTGLTPQQVKGKLMWLEHKRANQLNQPRKFILRNNTAQDRLIKDTVIPPKSLFQSKTYTISNNISDLHPKTIIEEFSR